MFKFIRYNDDQKEMWDQFVGQSINGTFLHFRNYMDYHKDRFQDHSFLIYDSKDELIALLPACIQDNKLISHGGLTYGGVVINKELITTKMTDMFHHLLEHLKQEKISQLHYKTIPSMYHKYPAEADLYALFLLNAELIRRDAFSVIDYVNKEIPAPQTRRLRSLKKAQQKGIIVEESNRFGEFHKVLSDVLYARHQIKPVHTLDELLLLKKYFPENIRLFESRDGEILLAGTLIYETATVAHAQYISSSPEGYDCGALDALMFYLIDFYKQSKSFFSFGISNEDSGRFLNRGLIEQKEGFGSRTIIHDHYLLNV